MGYSRERVFQTLLERGAVTWKNGLVVDGIKIRAPKSNDIAILDPGTGWVCATIEFLAGQFFFDIWPLKQDAPVLLVFLKICGIIREILDKKE